MNDHFVPAPKPPGMVPIRITIQEILPRDGRKPHPDHVYITWEWTTLDRIGGSSEWTEVTAHHVKSIYVAKGTARDWVSTNFPGVPWRLVQS